MDEREFAWVCAPWDPSVWPDGCPSAAVRPGDPCKAGTICTYGDEYDATKYTCQGGRWGEATLLHATRPPPPPPPP